jgi:hypothetical protein
MKESNEGEGEGAAPAGDEERQPLLGEEKPFDLDDLRQLRNKATKVAQLTDYTYVEYENMPAYVVFNHLVGAFMNTSVVLGAYFFLQSAGFSMTPHCSVYGVPDIEGYSWRKWKEYLCFASTGCFWTFPILCPLAIFLLYWKNLLDKRLYYECLFNKIFCLQRSSSHMTSPTFWFLLVYFCLGMSSLFFFKTQSRTGTKELVFGVLAYLSPTMGFLLLLFSQWSVNRLIVSLPIYVERDQKAAMDLVDNCTFVADEDFWKGFKGAEDRIARLAREQNMDITLTTAELMLLVEDIRTKWREPEYKTCWECVKDKLSKFYERYMREYWVSRFLFFKPLQDTRSTRFRIWARVYYFFIVLVIIVTAYALIYTINELLIFHETIPVHIPIPAPEEVPGAMQDGYEQAAPYVEPKLRQVRS